VQYILYDKGERKMRRFLVSATIAALAAAGYVGVLGVFTRVVTS
jgi:hypothetical protein